MSRSLRRIFMMPALVALASVVGLLSALAGDGVWDALSWLMLGWAVALAARHGLPRPRRRRRGQAAGASRG